MLLRNFPSNECGICTRRCLLLPRSTWMTGASRRTPAPLSPSSVPSAQVAALQRDMLLRRSRRRQPQGALMPSSSAAHDAPLDLLLPSCPSPLPRQQSKDAASAASAPSLPTQDHQEDGGILRPGVQDLWGSRGGDSYTQGKHEDVRCPHASRGIGVTLKSKAIEPGRPAAAPPSPAPVVRSGPARTHAASQPPVAAATFCDIIT